METVALVTDEVLVSGIVVGGWRGGCAERDVVCKCLSVWEGLMESVRGCRDVGGGVVGGGWFALELCAV